MLPRTSAVLVCIAVQPNAGWSTERRVLLPWLEAQIGVNPGVIGRPQA